MTFSGHTHKAWRNLKKERKIEKLKQKIKCPKTDFRFFFFIKKGHSSLFFFFSCRPSLTQSKANCFVICQDKYSPFVVSLLSLTLFFLFLLRILLYFLSQSSFFFSSFFFSFSWVAQLCLSVSLEVLSQKVRAQIVLVQLPFQFYSFLTLFCRYSVSVWCHRIFTCIAGHFF